MRRSLAVVALSIAATATQGIPAAGPDARKLAEALRYAQHGLAAIQRGNASRAADDFARALRDVPDLPEAHIGLGHVATRERRYDDALRAYRDAEAGYRAMASLLLQLANERYAQAQDELQSLRQEKARLDQELQQGAMLAESEAPGRASQAQLQRMRVEVDAKIQKLQSLPMPRPDAADEPPAAVYFFEGNALFALGRLDEAIATWERSRERDPKFAPVENNLAVAYWRRGRLDEAQASLSRAEKLGFEVNPHFRADLAAAAARARRGGN